MMKKILKKYLILFLTIFLLVSIYVFSVNAQGEISLEKDTAYQAVERNASEVGKIGDAIFNFAELGMQEFESNDLCARLLEEWGFKVEKGISGFPTALMATYGSGKPVIALHFEFDALPGTSQQAGVIERKPVVEGAPGHAEGHNTNAAVVMGAAFGIKEAIEKYNLKGTIKVFTAPAEEKGIPRPYFVRDGYFKDVDAAFHAHVGNKLSTSYGERQYAVITSDFLFYGKTAHAAVGPWTGVSAVDAAKLMDLGWDVLREHLPTTQRSHSVFTEGGIQPNVVPDFARISWIFRESNYERVYDLHEKAKKVAEGAALMTGCTWEEEVVSAIWPTRDNQTIAEVVQANIELVGVPQWTEEEQKFAKEVQKSVGAKETGLTTKITPLAEATQSTSANDSGDITWMVPHGRITFPANVSGIPGHHWAAAIVPATSIAHKAEVAGAKVLAGAVVDLLTQPAILEKAQETFKKEVGETKHQTLLPLDQKPPIEYNVEMMAKYRESMKPFYLKETIQFK
jgi:aminobenzoyl-glutamate utilization protein B